MSSIHSWRLAPNRHSCTRFDEIHRLTPITPFSSRSRYNFIMDPNLLVKLASAGTSGICIFAIYWTGFLILKSGKKLEREHHRTLRFFMASCIAIAVISATAAVAASWYDKRQLAETIAAVIRSKEASILRNPSPELESHVKMLRHFVEKTGVEIPKDSPP